jgi:predicted TIM-barrel fold metal-dependent hydrolase
MGGLRYRGRKFGTTNCTCISGKKVCANNHGTSHGSISRRHFLSRSTATLGLATLAAPVRAPFASAEPKKSRLIDVHYHIAPPAWAAALSTSNELRTVWEHWSVAKAIEDMDRDGVERAVTSITTPGVGFAGANAARLARECNEFAAKMRSDHPRRFGMFAVVPLPDIDASLAEIDYAMDTLKADGIGLLTSYDGKWLGHPAFEPVFAELNRRKVLIYTHPTEANCCRNLMPGIPSAIIEYGTDTSRAITEIVFGGTAKRYPDMRIIFSHAGGTLPFLVERVMFLERTQGHSLKAPEGGAVAALRNFHYDTAQAAMAAPMAALRQVAPLSHILFGTDYPYRTAAETFSELQQSHMFTTQELPAVERGNVLALLPQFAG